MKKNTILILILAFVFLCCAAVGVFFALDFFAQSDAIAIRETSVAELDTYMKALAPQPIVNEKALAALDAGATKHTAQIDALYYYETPEGFLIKSYSKAWGPAKLKDLYNELMKNTHGEELAYLYDIIVYAESDPLAAATHEDVEDEAVVLLNFPALPESFSFIFPFTSGRISLYDGDSITTVAGMAFNLSHEYGHHYAGYHMFRDIDFINGEKGDIETKALEHEYFKLRNLPSDIRYAMTDSKDYYKNHHWYAAEIAAFDYVQLLGSPNARKAFAYMDVPQWIEAEYKYDPELGYNAFGQENLLIPTAAETPGLAEYFHSFLGTEAPKPAAEIQEITIEVKVSSKGYNFVTGHESFNLYEFTWNMPYADAIYTLVCIDTSDGYDVLPIKTIYPGDKAIATIGTVTRKKGNTVYIYPDEYLLGVPIAEGTKTFYVIVMMPDGSLYRSTPLDYKF
ncbi:MAG: hypothetical protein FWF10_05295 [Clostridiales bacterium]|nr:hypothetical protein [Clostridiales bacterium]